MRERCHVLFIFFSKPVSISVDFGPIINEFKGDFFLGHPVARRGGGGNEDGDGFCDCGHIENPRVSNPLDTIQASTSSSNCC